MCVCFAMRSQAPGIARDSAQMAYTCFESQPLSANGHEHTNSKMPTYASLNARSERCAVLQASQKLEIWK